MENPDRHLVNPGSSSCSKPWMGVELLRLPHPGRCCLSKQANETHT